ncbi:hypothetical protein [Moraxella nonliquefaciens]|uniref:Uncharacterized protein n=1 Tax=Moraxella nonliquefaciens TaxID=478 RepID=A0A7T3BXI1_MORNO|nr:hypothetical protein [Moraxella nonliquefaciens]QPT43721.1 hypothetical protein I6G26_06385 [Moraxella nonliquefaciens]QQC30624.1 hypothetical protein I6H63_05180 [Moraxella nonliquefaciens]
MWWNLPTKKKCVRTVVNAKQGGVLLMDGTLVKGVCPSNNVPFGCYGTVNKGQFGGFLCVD